MLIKNVWANYLFSHFSLIRFNYAFSLFEDPEVQRKNALFIESGGIIFYENYGTHFSLL